jgi:glycosyltransferase involved in cell wall biosynthesis
MKIDLTIAIPTLNCLGTLRFTLESIRPLMQAGAKVVVADSYSTDGTPEYARHYGAEVVCVPKGNVSAALNAALSGADSEWLTCIPGDDLLYSDTVRRALSMVNPAADIVYGSIDFIDCEGRFIHGLQSLPERYLLAMAFNGTIPTPIQGLLFRQDVFRRLNGFDTNFHCAQDFDFSLRANIAGFKFWRITRPPIAAFRLHANQFSQRLLDVFLAEGRAAMKRSGVSASALARNRATAYYWMMNLPSYVLRLFRGKQLFGSYRLRRSLAVPPISQDD